MNLNQTITACLMDPTEIVEYQQTADSLRGSSKTTTNDSGNFDSESYVSPSQSISSNPVAFDVLFNLFETPNIDHERFTFYLLI